MRVFNRQRSPGRAVPTTGSTTRQRVFRRIALISAIPALAFVVSGSAPTAAAPAPAPALVDVCVELGLVDVNLGPARVNLDQCDTAPAPPATTTPPTTAPPSTAPATTAPPATAPATTAPADDPADGGPLSNLPIVGDLPVVGDGDSDGLPVIGDLDDVPVIGDLVPDELGDLGDLGEIGEIGGVILDEEIETGVLDCDLGLALVAASADCNLALLDADVCVDVALIGDGFEFCEDGDAGDGDADADGDGDGSDVLPALPGIGDLLPGDGDGDGSILDENIDLSPVLNCDVIVDPVVVGADCESELLDAEECVDVAVLGDPTEICDGDADADGDGTDVLPALPGIGDLLPGNGDGDGSILNENIDLSPVLNCDVIVNVLAVGADCESELLNAELCVDVAVIGDPTGICLLQEVDADADADSAADADADSAADADADSAADADADSAADADTEVEGAGPDSDADSGVSGAGDGGGASGIGSLGGPLPVTGLALAALLGLAAVLVMTGAGARLLARDPR